jgi:hypothetical protein
MDTMESTWDKFQKQLQDEQESTCDICKTDENLLTETMKNNLRADWAGVDFYNAVCTNCFETLKEEI